MERPFFSVIVVAYNAEELIAPTVRSVLQQSFQDYEIIVKDACSTDKTLEKVPQDPRVRVYSTKDSGIYDGMNEAVRYATGKFCTFLNCGDTFYDSYVLEKIYATAKDCAPDNTILYGDCCRGAYYVKQPGKITPFYLYRTPLNHQSMFFGTELFAKYGEYDAELKIAADYEFTTRAYKAGVGFVYCPVTVCHYLGGGVSESKKGEQIKKRDYEKIYSKYYTSGERRKYDLMLALSMKKLRQRISSGNSPKFLKRLYRALVNAVNK